MNKVLTKEMYDKYMQVNNERLDEINRELAFKPRAEWVDKLSYEQWVEWLNGSLNIFDPLNSEEIKSSREFNYYFNKGDEVMLDVSVMDDRELKYFKNEIGIKGVVDANYSDCHAFGRGSIYGHQVTFENGTIHGEEHSDLYRSFNTIGGYGLTWILIPFKGE